MWKKPEYTKKQINEAGQKIINPNITFTEFTNALDIIDNWRAAHAYPMNTFAVNLKRQVSDINGAVVVQRLKRLETICFKLRRYPEMNLYRMQDLGGCRVIVPNIDDVYKVKERLEKSRIRHIPKNPKDYIETPKPDTGYRGIHLIYKYKSDKNSDYDGLLVEIQIRTKLQHLWATAVETVGVFTDNGLKFNQGSEDWLMFFRLVSSVFAMEEGTPIGSDVPQKAGDLLLATSELSSKLNAIEKMRTIGVAVEHLGHVDKKMQNGYYLLKINYIENTITIQTFAGVSKGLDQATAAYNEFERNGDRENEDAVLVSAESYEALVDAYPNYFANITEFIDAYYVVMNRQYDILLEKTNESVEKLKRELEEEYAKA